MFNCNEDKNFVLCNKKKDVVIDDIIYASFLPQIIGKMLAQFLSSSNEQIDSMLSSL